MTDNPQIALDKDGYPIHAPITDGVRGSIQDKHAAKITRPLVRADGASCLTDEEIQSLAGWVWANTNIDRDGADDLREELRRRHSWTPPTVYPWADDEIVILEGAQGRSVYTKSDEGYDCYSIHFDTAVELSGYAQRVGMTIRRAVFVKDGE